MFFRFGSSVALVVAIALTGVALEKQNLEFRRKVTRQHYRMQVLQEHYAKLRLRTQQLGAPTRVIDSLNEHDLQLNPSASRWDVETSRMPLLRWQRPLSDSPPLFSPSP